jgi:pimeloyl-ACP methyl ester carboxylesterase
VNQPLEWTVETDDGVRLFGARWPASRPDAPVVLALHGITANRLAFLPLVDAFSGDVELFAYDARGRGRSDKPAEPERYGHGRHAADAAEVLRALTTGPTVIVGQSMGAWDSLLLAARDPELVHALVLGDGGYFTDLPDGVTPEAYVEGAMGAGWRQRMAVTLPSRSAALDIFRAMPPFADIWDDNLAAMLDEGLEDRPDGSVGPRCSVVGGIRLDRLLPALR